MVVTLIAAAAALIFGLLGYFRGIWRMVLFFLALIAAGLLAGFVAPLFNGLFRDFSLVPRALKPLAALVSAAIALFIVFMVIGSIIIHLRESGRKARQLPARQEWEKGAGALVGAVWGFFLVVLFVLGMQIIGDAEQAAARVSSAHAAWESGGRTTAGTVQTAEEGAPASSAGWFARFRESSEDSLIGKIAQMINPLGEKFWATYEDLVTVLSDPQLFESFRSHPDITRLAENPKIAAVAHDPNIQAMIAGSRYRELLDDPKIAELAQDKEIFRELRSLDFGRILREIIEGRSR